MNQTFDSADPERVPPFLAYAAYALALAVPPLYAYSLTPSPTLLNQLWSVAGWGGCLMLLFGHRDARPAASWRALGPLLAAFGLVMLSIAGSRLLGSLPTSLALPPFALAGAAGAVALAGARIARDAVGTRGGAHPRAFEPFALGLALAGTLSAVVAIVQVFWPEVPDTVFIARSGLVGRAVGNLRQPNHLASVLLWGLIALVPLGEWRPRWRPLTAVAALLMVFGVLLSASRTGWVGLALLFLWGLADVALLASGSPRRLAWPQRAALLAVPLVGVAMWYGLDAWAQSTHHVFGAHARLAEHDVSSSRFGIWGNTLSLIRQQPWWGVGWGEFNFAWTLTPFPGRPTAFFDHTHNLLLQLLVEMGVPLGLLTIALLGIALVLSGVRAWRVTGEAGVGARAAFAVVAMILVHSLFEYPLWYAYFLLPAAWAWGFALGPAAEPDAVPAAAAGTAADVASDGAFARWAMPTLGLAMLACALGAAANYWSISTIYAPADKDDPLEVRVAFGQRSPLFAHHADYADATSYDPPSNAHGAFDRATHSLLDTRLMTAWARELAAAGDLDRARYVAARLQEFGKDQSEGFFDACTDDAVQPKPFQCTPPSRALTWRDFQRR